MRAWSARAVPAYLGRGAPFRADAFGRRVARAPPPLPCVRVCGALARKGTARPAESRRSRRRFLARAPARHRPSDWLIAGLACVLAKPNGCSLRLRRPHSRGHRPRTSFAVSRAIREARSSPAAGAVAAAWCAHWLIVARSSPTSASRSVRSVGSRKSSNRALTSHADTSAAPTANSYR